MECKNSIPVGRSGMKGVVFEGKIWIMGGLTGVGNDYSNRVDVYDPATIRGHKCPIPWLGTGHCLDCEWSGLYRWRTWMPRPT